MGLASMEEVDAEAWFAGNKLDTSIAKLDEAAAHFRSSRQNFETAASSCAFYQQWFPADRKEEVTPDIDHFKWMSERLTDLISKLEKRTLPSLSDIHTVSASLRNEMVVAERKGIAHRGTRHHFPAGHP